MIDTLIASLMPAARAAAMVALGVLAARAARAVVGRMVRDWPNAERAALARRVVGYGVLGLAVAQALRELGFDLSVLLGAAGVLTVAVGFASQTSASNVVSGLFLVFENPFSVGDTVRIGTTTGVVLSIDLVSTKLRTFDNLFVRVPNETVMRSELVNMTRFPIRRVSLELRLPLEARVDELGPRLVEAVRAIPTVLDEPEPRMVFTGFDEVGSRYLLNCWAVRERFFDTRDEAGLVVQRVLREAGVVLAPVPMRLADGQLVLEPRSGAAPAGAPARPTPLG